jgi:hypothetical protein
VCGSVLTILFSAVFIYLFNYEIFNDIDFWNILTNYYYSYEEINSYLLPDFDVNIVLPFYNYSFIINPTDFFHFDWSNLQAFYADTFILGIYIYVENSAYLYTIAFFLFLATIIACSISLTKIKSLK